MTRKNFLRRLLPGFYVLPLFTLLLVLSRYSYSAKELLVCWLLFCSFFALLAVLFLAGVLACFAVQYLLNGIGVAKSVITNLAVYADVPLKPSPDPRILAARTFKLPENTFAALDALAPVACLSLEVPPSPASEQYV